VVFSKNYLISWLKTAPSSLSLEKLSHCGDAEIAETARREEERGLSVLLRENSAFSAPAAVGRAFAQQTVK
jgi:hypothetical protein